MPKSNTKTATSAKKEPAYIRLLRRPEGATSEELREKMGRVYGPTQAQLLPVAERFGYEYRWTKPEGQRTRYHFLASTNDVAAFERRIVGKSERAPRKR